MVEPKNKLIDDPIVLRILDLLQERSINEKELIERIGMARGTFTAWKYGRTKSYQRHISEIAEVLDVSPNYLLRGNDEEVDVETLSEAEKELVKAYRDVGVEGQRHINEMISYILEAKRGREQGDKSEIFETIENPHS